LGVQHLQHYLVFSGTIEHHGRTVAPCLGDREYIPRRLSRQQVPQMCPAAVIPNHRAIADNHGQRSSDLLSNWYREIVSTPSDQRHLNPASGRFSNSLAIRLGQLPAAIQQRAVDIQCNQAHTHTLFYREFRPYCRCGFAKRRGKRLCETSKFMNRNGNLLGLECSECQKSFDAAVEQHLCICGKPLLARYDLKAAGRTLSLAALASRPYSLWRYREVLPPGDPVTLGEGMTA